MIDILHGHPPALEWFVTLAEAPRLPGLVAMELDRGMQYQSGDASAQRISATVPDPLARL